MKTDKKIHRKPNNKTNVCTCAFYTPKKQEKRRSIRRYHAQGTSNRKWKLLLPCFFHGFLLLLFLYLSQFAIDTV